MNGLMGSAPHFPHVPVVPSSGQGPAGLRMPPPQGPPQDHGPNIQALAGEGEQDVMSTAQRGMLKWEKEETLGELATVAPVLYCNTNFPQLKEQYPGRMLLSGSIYYCCSVVQTQLNKYQVITKPKLTWVFGIEYSSDLFLSVC